jgi:UDP-glucose 4-epimerase
MNNSKILVTGGAGYIGSHVVRQLGLAGEAVVTLDNLSTGFEAAVTAGDLVIGDTGDAILLDKIFNDHNIDTVMHFAAHTIVPESVSDPLKYYRNNTASSRTLLEAAQKHGVKNIVFSSTAAVYGIPEGGKASEDSATQPINPYGTSKLMTEWMLRDLTGRRPKVAIYGTDYPTPDGTGLRDYIHVDDLATAHLDALNYLRAGGDSTVLNCGYGHGYSVREVLAAVENANGAKLNIAEEPRRAGDPPELIAVANRVREVLGWAPRHDDLDTIVRTALAWERKIASRDPSAYWAV